MRNWTQEALDYLREEIKATTADAEARINKAAESVTTLKDMIQAKQVELIQRRKEVSRLYHDAESVELENQKLQVQLTRASLHVGGQSQHDGEEAEQLRREAEDFHTQKEALLLILRDFYGAMGEVDIVGSVFNADGEGLCFEAVRRLAFSVPLGSGPAALEQGSIGLPVGAVTSVLAGTGCLLYDSMRAWSSTQVAMEACFAGRRQQRLDFCYRGPSSGPRFSKLRRRTRLSETSTRHLPESLT
ncbi:unnamed protein product [Symbiodinium sp. CCMP2456]|nr:unnamed protein product [Symbiodinium sp. CCMP2456]